jgi:hypothetical protein
MNRTNIGKQLSGFVGQDVSRQFAQKPRKLYAEGDTVEVESEETITKTFPNGKTWTWNPSIESEPDPETGRTRKFNKATGKMIGSEAGLTEQLTGLGGVNLFGQATEGKAQEQEEGQKVPVSIVDRPINPETDADEAERQNERRQMSNPLTGKEKDLPFEGRRSLDSYLQQLQGSKIGDPLVRYGTKGLLGNDPNRVHLEMLTNPNPPHIRDVSSPNRGEEAFRRGTSMVPDYAKRGAMLTDREAKERIDIAKDVQGKEVLGPKAMHEFYRQQMSKNLMATTDYDPLLGKKDPATGRIRNMADLRMEVETRDPKRHDPNLLDRAIDFLSGKEQVEKQDLADIELRRALMEHAAKRPENISDLGTQQKKNLEATEGKEETPPLNEQLKNAAKLREIFERTGEIDTSGTGHPLADDSGGEGSGGSGKPPFGGHVASRIRIDTSSPEDRAKAAAETQYQDYLFDEGRTEDPMSAVFGVGDFYDGLIASGGPIPFAQGGGLSSLADKNLAPGSFVLSADVISGIGDGSSESGLRRLNTELGFPITPNGVEGRAYGGTISGTVRGPGSGLDDLNQTTIAGKQAAALANQEVVVSPGSVTRLAQMLYPDKKMSTQEALKSGQEALYNFQKNIRQQKADSSKGGKQPGPLKTGKGGLRDLMMAG